MFIADTIALDEGRAVAAIRRMRERLRRPEMTAGDLLLRMKRLASRQLPTCFALTSKSLKVTHAQVYLIK